MNTCCKRCSGRMGNDPFCGNRICRCHQEKPTHESNFRDTTSHDLPNHEIGWGEKRMILLKVLKTSSIPLDVIDAAYLSGLQASKKEALTHQKESILSKLVRKEHTPDCINREDGYGHLYRDCNQNCQANGYNQGIADAIEAVKLG